MNGPERNYGGRRDHSAQLLRQCCLNWRRPLTQAECNTDDRWLSTAKDQSLGCGIKSINFSYIISRPLHVKRRTHRIRSIQNAQQAIRHSSVIFVAPYWNYRISCLKVQLAPLAQDADSEKWNISLDYVKKKKKKGLSPDLEYFRLPTSKRSRLIIIMPSHCYWSWFDHSIT